VKQLDPAVPVDVFPSCTRTGSKKDSPLVHKHCFVSFGLAVDHPTPMSSFYRLGTLLFHLRLSAHTRRPSHSLKKTRFGCRNGFDSCQLRLGSVLDSISVWTRLRTRLGFEFASVWLRLGYNKQMIDGQNIDDMARGMFRNTDLSPTDWDYFVWPEITSHSKQMPLVTVVFM
jgi:hypothetical protein